MSPKSDKGVRNFLGYDFIEECLSIFNTLKEKLTSTPVIITPNWSLSFELMCDASDYTERAVLGQHKNKIIHVIYYSSKTLNDAQLIYATPIRYFSFWFFFSIFFFFATKNELLAVVVYL